MNVLLLEHLETSRERVGDLEVGVVTTARPSIVERGLHLLDRRNHPLRLLDHPLLLRRHLAHLVVECIGQGREELQHKEFVNDTFSLGDTEVLLSFVPLTSSSRASRS